MADIFSSEYAKQLDAQDPLARFRDEFRLPTNKGIKADLVSQELGLSTRSRCIGAILMFCCFSGLAVPLFRRKLSGTFA